MVTNLLQLGRMSEYIKLSTQLALVMIAFEDIEARL
jgi:hypothetical protein